MAARTRYELDTDHLMALVERMQQAGHTERQISVAIAGALRAPRKGLAERLRDLGRALTGAGAAAPRRPAVA
jgi:hypothetical protein